MIIKTKCGEIEGVFEEKQYVFKGIPYAESPVGSLRFKKPQPKKPWNGVLRCNSFGTICVQNVEDNMKNLVSEDSLTLNIWTKSIKEPNKAVVLWVHGGGFTRGFGSQYSGVNFADDDIVFVSLNYRLGVFGFLDLEGVLGDEYKSSGNNGILDIIEALKWIKENIEFFGGDKNNVTVMGESAGAKCIGALLISPLAKGLFNKAILESGALQAIRDKTTSKEITKRFLNSLNINKDNIHNLLTLDYNQILNAQNKISDSDIGMLQVFGPVIDGECILYSGLESINKDVGSLVPCIIGTNLKESNLQLAFSKELRDRDENCIKELFGKNYKNILTSYNKIKNEHDDAWQTVLTDYLYKIHSYRLASKLASLGKDVYLYRFDWSGNIGPCHAQELPFVFKGIKGEPIALFNLKEEDMPLSDTINGYWKNFIKISNPNKDGFPIWEKFNDYNKLIIFNNKITNKILQKNWDDKLCENQVFSLLN